MVTVADWDEYHDGGFLTPSIWYTRPSNGTLAHLDLVAAADPDARFAVSAVAGAQILRARSAEAERSRLERVYVTVPPMS